MSFMVTIYREILEENCDAWSGSCRFPPEGLKLASTICQDKVIVVVIVVILIVVILLLLL